MPRTKEEIKEYQRQYRIKNKEKIAEQRKQYRAKLDKEKLKEYQKKYKQENREKIRGVKREYHLKNPHIQKISGWKRQGIISDNWDELYDKFIKTEYCEVCNIKLTTNKVNCSTTKCIDHDHKTGLVRNILCLVCNTQRG